MRSAFLGPTIQVKDYVHDPNPGYKLLITRDTSIMMKAPPSTCASPKGREFGESKVHKNYEWAADADKAIEGGGHKGDLVGPRFQAGGQHRGDLEARTVRNR